MCSPGNAESLPWETHLDNPCIFLLIVSVTPSTDLATLADSPAIALFRLSILLAVAASMALQACTHGIQAALSNPVFFRRKFPPTLLVTCSGSQSHACVASTLPILCMARCEGHTQYPPILSSIRALQCRAIHILWYLEASLPAGVCTRMQDSIGQGA